jgi:ArsR family transcriptional regulator
LATGHHIIRSYFLERDALEPVSRVELRERVKKGLVTILDVRPGPSSTKVTYQAL